MFDRPLSMLAAGLFVLGACAGACTAALDFTECRQDSDCSNFYEDDKPMRCADYQCVTRDRCEGNSQCAGLGEGFVCTVVGTCVQVKTDNCAAPIYPDDEPTDDVVLVGSIVALEGPDAALGTATDAAIRQAVADFNATTKLQGGKAIALVPCDSKGSVDQAVTAATHLGEALAVPAILGPLSDLELYEVAENVSLKNGVRAFTQSPTAAVDIDFPDMNLVWQTSVAVRYQGRGLGEHLKFAADNGAFGGGAPETVMLFAQNDRYGYDFYDAIATKEIPGNINGIPEAGSQKIASYKTAADGSTSLDDFVKPTTQALILIGGSEVADMLAHYAGTGNPWPERVYIGPRSAAAVIELGDDTLTSSLRLVAPDLETDAAAALKARTTATMDPLAYDATMTTLLSMAAIPGSSAITGPNIAKNMARLGKADGLVVSFGDDPTTFIKAAVDALAQGKNLQVDGASGTLDFQDDGTICDALAAYSFDGAAFTRVERFVPNCDGGAGVWSKG